MFKKIITSKGFWRYVLLFTVEFIVFFNIVRIAMEYKFRFREFFSYYFSPENLPSFIVYNLIVGILFGLAMGFSRSMRAHKKKK